VTAIRPAEVYVLEDGEIQSTEYQRVRFAPQWDYSFFPFESHQLHIAMQTRDLTDLLEPLTVEVDENVFSNELAGWTVSRNMQVMYSGGTKLGPAGLWGSSQHVDITLEIFRTRAYGTIRVFFPSLLCALLVYAGFFMEITELMSRLLLPIFSAVILTNFMISVNNEAPHVGYMTLSDWFVSCQLVIMCGSALGHMAAEVLKFSRSFRSIINMDRTFRMVYWPIFVMSFVVAGLLTEWQHDSSSSSHLLGGIVIAAVALTLPVLVFLLLERHKPPVHEKLDDRL